MLANISRLLSGHRRRVTGPPSRSQSGSKYQVPNHTTSAAFIKFIYIDIFIFKVKCIWQYVCLYIEIYAYLSQRRTEPHVSTVNTMTEALDIQKARHSEISLTKREQKRWHCKDLKSSCLSCRQNFMNVFFLKLQSLEVKLQSCFIWNSPTYSAERHSDNSVCIFLRNRSDVYSSEQELLVAF